MQFSGKSFNPILRNAIQGGIRERQSFAVARKQRQSSRVRIRDRRTNYKLIKTNSKHATIFRLSINYCTTKQFQQPCNNKSAILPHLSPQSSPPRTGGDSRYLHVPHLQPTREAQISTIRQRKRVTIVRTEIPSQQIEA